jgi:hypothetical protein
MPVRYPLNAHRKELAVVEGAWECENQLAKEIQDDELGNEEGSLGGVGQVLCLQRNCTKRSSLARFLGSLTSYAQISCMHMFIEV